MDEAEELLLKGSDFNERINHYLWDSNAKFYLGEIYFIKGEYQKSNEYYMQAISAGEKGKSLPSWRILFKIASARAKAMNDEKEIGLETLYGLAAENKIKAYEGWMARYIGEILLNIDDQPMAEAEDWIRNAIEADKRNGMMWQLGRDHLSYAELLKRKGDIHIARENLSTAAQIFEECGADGDLKKAKALLEKLS